MTNNGRTLCANCPKCGLEHSTYLYDREKVKDINYVCVYNHCETRVIFADESKDYSMLSDREIDVLIVKEILGWKHVKYSNADPSFPNKLREDWYGEPPDYYHIKVPHYCEMFGQIMGGAWFREIVERALTKI